MGKLSLKERLKNWVYKQDGWVASGDIQRVATNNTSYTPSNISRRLRELENEGILEVKYITGHAWYRRKVRTNEEVEQFFASL